MSSAAAIILSSESNISDRRNVLTKEFPKPYDAGSNDRLSLSNLTMPYSINNVTTTFNNRSFEYTWVDGTVHTVLYPPGSYTVADLNDFSKNYMSNLGHFLVDSLGSNVYYLSFVINPIYYTITATMKPVPTTLGDYTNPNSVPLNGKVPQFTILGTNSFGKLLGFVAGSYPATLAVGGIQDFNSQIPPIISPITSINIACSWVSDNRFDKRANILTSFVPTVPYGATISFSPVNLVALPVSQRQWTEISVEFLDQNYKALELVDISQIQVSLLLTS